MKYVSLWDFSSAIAGWSGNKRDCELCIEANLVDPSVAWELKNIFLIHFKDALVPLLIKDHRFSPPPTTQNHRDIPPDTPLIDMLTTYSTDRRSGMYKYFKTEAGEIYNAKCTTLWKELRLDAMHTALDHARATIKTALQDEAWKLRSTTSVETLEAEMWMLRKQNEARDREIVTTCHDGPLTQTKSSPTKPTLLLSPNTLLNHLECSLETMATAEKEPIRKRLHSLMASTTCQPSVESPVIPRRIEEQLLCTLTRNSPACHASS